MAVQFRNLEVTPRDPVDRWGPEGILTAIDRGGLAEWRRISRALAADPHGPVAADLEEALELAEDAGAARVLQLALERARASEAERVGWRIREYLWRANMTQAELARAVAWRRRRAGPRPPPPRGRWPRRRSRSPPQWSTGPRSGAGP